ncbi:MAG: LemA family protein [Bdellovibrionales bacterium]|nr:LemA family protein [Bdellovibrionales bacterium]
MNKSIAFFAGLVALGVFLLIGVVGVISYNSLVGARERVNSNWAQVENVYQRRLDLVPLLVNAVKSYVEHEQATLEGVTEARARALGAMQALKGSAPDSLEKLKALESAQADLGGALGRLLAVSENYPDLKASQNFLALQDQIEGTENRIAVERRNFNESSRAYNTRIQRFPSLVFAQAFGFDAKPYFQASSEALSPLKDPFKGE